MFSTKFTNALALLATAAAFTAEALPQNNGAGLPGATINLAPGGYLDVTLTSPNPLPATAPAAIAAVTFVKVPNFNDLGVETFVNCQIRAPELGGDRGGARGYVGHCDYPGPEGVDLANFKKNGSMVTLGVRNEWRGGKGVMFQVYVTSGRDTGNPMAMTNVGSTLPFDFAA